MSFIWLMSLRDLRWRARSLMIAVLATSLVFALALLLWGFREGLEVEVHRTISAIGADSFVVDAGVAGPFTSLAQVDGSVVESIKALPGVEDAALVLTIRHSIESRPVTDVYLIGAEPGHVGMATVQRGRAPAHPGEAALGTAANRHIGDDVRVGGRIFQVVGLVGDVSVWAHLPVMFVTLGDAQQLVFAGKNAGTAVVTAGVPLSVATGLKVILPANARDDLKRPTANAIDTVDGLRILLWMVAAAIVGSVLYISAIERSRDFAVFKAFGTSNCDIVGSILVEAVVITLVSVGVGIALAHPMSALFPAIISIPARIVLFLPLLALLVGIVGGLAGARRALAVAPATAFASR